MPSPVTPNQVKALIPGPTGNVCEKLANLFDLPRLYYLEMAYRFNEDGTISEAFKADLCALNCLGGSDGGVGTPTTFGRPDNVSASDGSSADSVIVTWSEVGQATAYDVFRSASADSSTAALIGSTADLTFEDTSVVPGTTYYYWVKARNDVSISAFSNPDTGYAALGLPPVLNLQATKGVSTFGAAAYVALVFEPVDGATHYDFYISDSDDFSTAMLLDGGRTPFDNQGTDLLKPPGSTKPVFVNNQTDLVYHWFPAEVEDTYSTRYFWVVAKVMDGSQVVSVAVESNSAAGWATGFGDGPYVSAGVMSAGETVAVPAGITRLWFAVHGAGAAGAGGDGNDGGAGGGGGAMFSGWVNVGSGSKVRLVDTPAGPSVRTPHSTAGADGPVVTFEYSANGLFTDTVTLVSFTAPTGGGFTDGGLGAGGSAATVGAVHGSVQDANSWDGNDGLPAKAGGTGGSGGHRFGLYRARNATGTATVGDGENRGAGGGANSNPALPTNATGGRWHGSFAMLTYRA